MDTGTSEALARQLEIANEACATLDDATERLIYEILERIADKWSCWVLCVLGEEGRLRFSRLMEHVEGVSQKMLTKNLRRLERDGLITRTMYMEVPPRVEYELTELGRRLLLEVLPLCGWISREIPAFKAARARFDGVAAQDAA